MGIHRAQFNFRVRPIRRGAVFGPTLGSKVCQVSDLRIVLAQIDPTVGDVASNAQLIFESCVEAHALGADLIAFPEMALTGYPVEDLALRRSFQAAAQHAVEQLAQRLAARGLGQLTVILGTLSTSQGQPCNAAVLLRNGVIEATYVKHHLPNYGVFDERRIFAAGDAACVFVVRDQVVSLAICEDIWAREFPAAIAARTAPIDLLVVLNASPFEMGKHHRRIEVCKERAAEIGAPLAYVALAGGQDDLVFDGGSMLVAANGDVLTAAPRFISTLHLCNLGTATASHPSLDSAQATDTDPLDEIYDALVLGVRDYVRKNGMTSVVLGLSGGIDSALVAAIACDAFGAQNVYGVAMPSRYSSDHSVEDAVALAENTGLALRHVPITEMFDAYQKMLNLTGLAEENLQARVRGTTLMAISNAEGHLVLATGNKSEVAVGYSTIYGDAVGGFAPIKDVPKTIVWELARRRNERARFAAETPPIPERSITKEPSAELRPDQRDTDSLPEYAELDQIIERYVQDRVSVAELADQGFDPALSQRVIQLIDRAEYKRRQYPPGTKITGLAFGRDRRLPITNRWSEPGATDE